MTDPERLSQVFVEVADTLVERFDVVDFMTLVAHRCVELLGGQGAGVLLGDDAGTLTAVASTHESVSLLDLFEQQNHEGPALDAYQSGRTVANESIESARERWPHFAELVARAGFAQVHAIPMRLHGQAVGAVTIFSSSASKLEPADLEIAQALADVATIALMQQRKIRHGLVLAEQLQSALNSRVVIEQAKGVLAERLHVDMDTAFRALRAHARSNGRLLSVVAREVIDGAAMGTPEIRVPTSRPRAG
jgi:transcriptional regulator with GAF, ATPase, and Fis domain